MDEMNEKILLTATMTQTIMEGKYIGEVGEAFF